MNSLTGKRPRHQYRGASLAPPEPKIPRTPAEVIAGLKSGCRVSGGIASVSIAVLVTFGAMRHRLKTKARELTVRAEDRSDTAERRREASAALGRVISRQHGVAFGPLQAMWVMCAVISVAFTLMLLKSLRTEVKRYGKLKG